MTCKGYKTKCWWYTTRKSYPQCTFYNRKKQQCKLKNTNTTPPITHKELSL